MTKTRVDGYCKLCGAYANGIEMEWHGLCIACANTPMIDKDDKRLNQFATKRKAHEHKKQVERETGKTHIISLTITTRNLEKRKCWTIHLK